MSWHLLLAMVLLDAFAAGSFFLEGKYPMGVIFFCATVANIASFWLI